MEKLVEASAMTYPLRNQVFEITPQLPVPKPLICYTQSTSRISWLFTSKQRLGSHRRLRQTQPDPNQRLIGSPIHCAGEGTGAEPAPAVHFTASRAASLSKVLHSQVPDQSSRNGCGNCRFQLIRRPSHFRVRFFKLNRRLTRLFSAKS
jgi:hypothetical protein